MIKLNSGILEVLCMVYHYKHDRVMDFSPDAKPYKEWMKTNEDDLNKFVWKYW